MGRNTLYGVAVGGQHGAAHVLRILKTELVRSMILLGTARLSDIGSAHVADLGHWDQSVHEKGI